MKVNRKSLLKILSLGLVCALMIIFLFFAGCVKSSSDKAEKSSTGYENPEASEYGLYTKLTLTLDCGDGKVWATVKNTFTVLPSAVRVNVELYRSESYKPDYKEMELVSEKSVEDLDIFKTITTEAPAGDRTYFWQARMYYRIDDGEWRESLSKVMAINSEGKIVTTVNEIETLPEKVCLKDIIKGEANYFDFTKVRQNEPKVDYYDNEGNYHYSLDLIAGWGKSDIKEEVNTFYDFFKNVECFKNDNDYFIGLAKFSILIKFDSGYCFSGILFENGKIEGKIKFDNQIIVEFAAEEGSVNCAEVKAYLDNFMITEWVFPNYGN